MEQIFDTLVVITPKDFLRLKSNYIRLVRWLPKGRIMFIGSEEVGRLVNDLIKDLECGEDRLGFLNENDIIPFDDVHKAMTDKMKPLLEDRELPRGVTGWYYQQFLKMEYSKMCENEYYMSWDGDTVPCKDVVMFREDGTPYLDLKHEYNELYFTTMGRLIPGLKKLIEASFISEHMMFKCDIMKRLIEKIELNDSIPGIRFYEKIISCIPLEDIQENGFSEFETYGSFVCLTMPQAYRLREWHSFRLAGEFFDPDKITDEDYEWLGRDFDAVSFEKGMTVREDHKNLFDNKEYQSKLSARQMLEIAQEEFQSGYKEVWK
ncbi:MAG: DUF6492 family protein [Lachnospiraceae bacterium]|nr:DUF6492 family protein [Lachnospiraceae bacterium]